MLLGILSGHASVLHMRGWNMWRIGLGAESSVGADCEAAYLISSSQYIKDGQGHQKPPGFKIAI